MARQQYNFSLILLVAIGIFVLAGLQIARIIVQRIEQEPTVEDPLATLNIPEKPELTGNVFQDLKYTHPKRNLAIQRLPGKPLEFDLPVFDHNITEGSPDTVLKLTIFSDPSCGPCRRQVQDVQRMMPANTHVVHKFFPTSMENTNGGLFSQLAARHGYWPGVRELLAASDKSLDIGEWTELLENAGMPLRQQRRVLAREGEQISLDLQKDFDLARQVDIQQIPAFFLNAYFLDGTFLTLERLPRYVRRLQEGEPIMQAVDYASTDPDT
jgi:protein-disulfide isomerase